MHTYKQNSNNNYGRWREKHLNFGSLQLTLMMMMTMVVVAAANELDVIATTENL